MSLFRSFRVRMALLTTALSGLVLVAFGSIAWAVLYRQGLDRVDNLLLSTGYNLLQSMPLPENWAGDSPLVTALEERELPVCVRVTGPRSLAYQSPNWPDGLTVPDLPPLPDSDDATVPANPPPRADGSRPRPPPPVNGDRRTSPLKTAAPTFITRTLDGQSWRLLTIGNPGVTLTAATTLGGVRSDMERMRSAFLIALPLALLLVAGMAWLLAQRALRPVTEVSRLAEELTAEELSRRLPTFDGDKELLRLVHVFNSMLDRLERSFGQATRFSADAAHELKTPLAILQGELEQAVQDAPPGSDHQQTYSRLLDEVQRLKGITRKLLLLSLADAGNLPLKPQLYDLSGAINDMLEDFEVLAPGQRIETDLDSRAKVMADPDLIRQVLQNLLNNAIRYNHEGGLIRVVIARVEREVVLTIANSGDPIPESERERIFDRFYRSNKARDRSSEGVGLGLSLTREIVRAHGGDITLVPDDQFVTFRLVLPRAPESIIETAIARI